MKRDLLLTFITEGLVLLCGLLVYRLAKQQLGTEGFAIYALSRRTHSFVAPALLIGCGVAIPRFIAFNKVHNEELADSYYKAGALLVGMTTLIFVLSANIFSGHAANLFFGEPNMSGLLMPISIMMIGFVLHSLCYAYYRGYSRMLAANLLQIINIAVVPLTAMLFLDSTSPVLFWTGAGWTVVGGIVLFGIIIPRLSGRVSSNHWKELLVFGIQRVPADFGAAALFGLPATITAHYVGVIAGGHVAFSISLLNMCGAVFAPIGLVLLPKASEAIARKDTALIKRYLFYVITVASSVSLAMVIVFESASSSILQLYLGSSVELPLVTSARIIMLAAVPYAIYVAARSIIDAFFTRPINALNIILSLSVFILLSFGARMLNISWITPLIALVAAVVSLGILTLIVCSRIVKNWRSEGLG